MRETKGIKCEMYKYMLIFNAFILVFCHFPRGEFKNSMSRCETLTPQTHEKGDPSKIQKPVSSYPSKDKNVSVDLPSSESVKKFTKFTVASFLTKIFVC